MPWFVVVVAAACVCVCVCLRPPSLSLLLFVVVLGKRNKLYLQDLSALSYTSILGVLGTVYTAVVMGIRFFDKRCVGIRNDQA